MPFSKTQPVFVIVPPKLDLKGVQKVTAEALNIVGCPNCHSGYDLRFLQQEVIFFDKGLESQTFNGR